MLKRSGHAIGHALRVTLGGTFPSKLLERLLRRESRIVALLGMLVGQFVEIEAAPVGDLQASCERLRGANSVLRDRQ